MGLMEEFDLLQEKEGVKLKEFLESHDKIYGF